MQASIQYDEIWQTMIEGYQLSSQLHGPGHWKRVEQNGLQIALSSNADVVVVKLFAVLHDSQRWNDGYDPDHGHRAADVAEHYRFQLFAISDQQMNLLVEALRYHNDGQVSGNATIGTCWDADRMDLPRVGLIPDPDLMSTTFATKWAHNYQR